MWREIDIDALISWASDNARRLQRDVFVTSKEGCVAVTFDEPCEGKVWHAMPDGRLISTTVYPLDHAIGGRVG